MGVSINQVYNLCYYIASKQLSGFPSPQEFSEYCQLANVDLYNYYNDERDKMLLRVKQGDTTYSPEILNSFIVNNITMNFVGNSASKPLDYIDSIAINTTPASGVLTRIPKVDIDKLPDTLKSTIDAPTASRPIHVELSDSFLTYPTLTTPVLLSYYKFPNTVFWNYSMESGRPAYNPTGTIDFEWQETELFRLTSRVLKYMSVSIRDSELEQAAQEMVNTAS